MGFLKSMFPGKSHEAHVEMRQAVEKALEAKMQEFGLVQGSAEETQE